MNLLHVQIFSKNLVQRNEISQMVTLKGTHQFKCFVRWPRGIIFPAKIYIYIYIFGFPPLNVWFRSTIFSFLR